MRLPRPLLITASSGTLLTLAVLSSGVASPGAAPLGTPALAYEGPSSSEASPLVRWIDALLVDEEERRAEAAMKASLASTSQGKAKAEAARQAEVAKSKALQAEVARLKAANAALVKEKGATSSRLKAQTAALKVQAAKTRQATARLTAQEAATKKAQGEAKALKSTLLQVGVPREAVAAAAAGRAPSLKVTAGGTPASNKALAAALMRQRGYSDAEISCAARIWQQESQWNHKAKNPSSGAYGIPQALPGRKMASAGSDWATNPATQIKWGLSYMEERYGSPCKAASFKFDQGHGWY